MADTLGVILTTRDGARAAADGARGVVESRGEMPQLVLGVIAAVTGSLYSVDLLGSTTATKTRIPSVSCVPYVALAVDDVVWVVMPRGGQGQGRPVIMGGAGTVNNAADNLSNCGIIAEY